MLSRSALDCKKIKPVNHKGNQSWIYIGRTDAEAEAPILQPPAVKNWLIMPWKTEGRRRREWQRMRWLDGIINLMDMNLHKLWELGDGQGSLACCSPWGCKESDMTEQLNNNKSACKCKRCGTQTWSTMGLQRVGQDWVTFTFTFTFGPEMNKECIQEMRNTKPSFTGREWTRETIAL